MPLGLTGVQSKWRKPGGAFTNNEVVANRSADSVEDQFRKNQAQRQENLKKQSQPSTAAAGGQSLVPVDLLQK